MSPFARLRIFIIFGLLIFSGAARSDPGSNYELVSRNSELELYRKKSVGSSDLIAFRGIGILAGSPVEVATGILDRAHRPEWMRDVRDLKVVRILSPGHFIEYSGIQTPFIVKNRDFVIRTDIEVDSTRTKILIQSRSVVDEAVPEGHPVRGKMTEGRFFLEPGPRPGTTKLTADMDVDPMGSIPRWMVNNFQENWPVVMFYGLKGFLARGVATLPDDLQPLFAKPADSK